MTCPPSTTFFLRLFHFPSLAFQSHSLAACVESLEFESTYRQLSQPSIPLILHEQRSNTAVNLQLLAYGT